MTAPLQFREVAYRVTSVLWGLRCDREDRVRTILPSDQDRDPAPCLGPWSLRPAGSPPGLLWRSWRAVSPAAWGPSPPPPTLQACSVHPSPPPPSHRSRSKKGVGVAQPPRLPRELLEINPFSMNKARGQRESVLRVDKLCGGPREAGLWPGCDGCCPGAGEGVSPSPGQHLPSEPGIYHSHGALGPRAESLGPRQS